MAEVDPEHVDDLYGDLTNAILQGKSPADALTQLRRDQERLFGRYPQALDDRLTALDEAHRRLLAQQNRVSYLQKRALRFGREQWYLGPNERDSHWQLLRARLAGQGRSDEEIELTDSDSTTVVGLLDNPSKEAFSSRGLVVGHVQSGKTGNMAAVIAKAADTPFKFFLILSGITDQLRNQTQVRLGKDVTSLAPERWMNWTAPNTPELNGEFSERAAGGFSFDHRNQIAVIKKNGPVLRRFLAKIRNTDAATLRNTPFLIIDDEADQASVNSARYATSITKINDVIRQLLKELPRVAYVGYTATPFANVLIDATVPEDLYPRHFIHALKRPRAYFGPQELFGRHALEGEYDDLDDGLDMIRDIPDTEIPLLRPRGRQQGGVELTPSLQAAIRYFVMVVAARRARGQADRHNTMLVHTSMFNSVHRLTEAAIRPYVATLQKDLKAEDADLSRLLAAEWASEQERVLSEQFDLDALGFDRLAPFLESAAADLTVHVENWSAVERLDYSGGPRTYLVIGGNVLARGLTLEGLSVSYFLRTSSQYDTLMQMGRWFGYRSGFEDLPRIWVERRVRDAFYDLATIEAEIRRDIARYAEEELTPEMFAVRIRKIPGMTITAPAKMRTAVPVAIGYAGTHVQTFRFKRRDDTWLRENWNAGARLVDASGAHVCEGNAKVFRGVPASLIEEFLSTYKAHESHKDLAGQFLAAFVAKGAGVDPRMSRWSVVVVGTADGTPSMFPLGNLGKVPTVVRSAETDTGDEASIKALMSRKDVVLDLAERPARPDELSWADLKAWRERTSADALLLLYPIEAKSEPRVRESRGRVPTREPLDAERDVLGFGIVFPGDKVLSGTYVAANIQPDQGEPIDEAAEEDKIPAVLLDTAGTDAA